MPRTISREVSIHLPHSPERLWNYVADTDRMDRAIGLPAAKFSEIPKPEGGETVVGEYRRAGFLIARWLELPFEWEWPRYFTVIREYDRGPLVRLFTRVDLVPHDQKTEVRLRASFTVRNWLHYPIIRYLVTPATMRRSLRQYQAISDFLSGEGWNPFPTLARLDAPAKSPLLNRLIERLQNHGAASEPSRRLRTLLLEGSDEEVAGMRPFELADRWQTDRRETLETFLHATVSGVVDMDWELLCPSCRGVRARADRLRDLEATGYCPACNLPVAANADEAIEARFYPAPAIREVHVGTYCVGSPMKTPHRRAHAVLGPGGTRAWHLRLDAGRYVVRSPQSSGTLDLQVAPDAPAERVSIVVRRDEIISDQERLKAGEVVLGLNNETLHEITIALDSRHSTATAALASELMTLPAFRAFFSAEALAPGVELSISRVCLLFTDLAGSTALYERIGEARAFRLVSEHFDILRSVIEANNGAVVKTIGDAVMAAFTDGRSTVAAALAMQFEIRKLKADGVVDPIRFLKVGIHAGPCYAVTMNDRLDYFGTAVNLASRAQREARGGEIVATYGLAAELEELLPQVGLESQVFEARFQDFVDPITLYRVDCSRLTEKPFATIDRASPSASAAAHAV